MKNFYLVMSLVGLIIPYSFFSSYINLDGMNVIVAYEELVSSTLSLFAWSDIIISAIVLIVFIIVESKKIGMKKYFIPILGTLFVGVSFGLPLFLYLREKHLLEQSND